MNGVKTFLLADDGEDDVFFLRRAFEKAGIVYPLNVVPDGEEAISYLSGTGKYNDRAAYPLPTVLLLDINMPRKNGHEVLAWVRSQPQFRKLPVIMFTSSKSESDVEKAYELGATSYFVKPSGYESLDQSMLILSKYWMEIDHRR